MMTLFPTHFSNANIPSISPSPTVHDSQGLVDAFPQTYIQSGIFTGDPANYSQEGNYAWGGTYFDAAKKNLLFEYYSTLFNGTEVMVTSLRSPNALEDLRETSDALRNASKAKGEPFVGFYNFPRVPGFFFENELAMQPAEYRSYGLKSNGTLWKRVPSKWNDAESIIGLCGRHFDMSNTTARSQFFANFQKVMSADGKGIPKSECTGNLYGYAVFNEWRISTGYTSWWGSDPTEVDVDSADRVMRLNHYTQFQLMIDGDPYYSFLGPPKRAVPLFSENSNKSFVAYAHGKGIGRINWLPADRNEFNDDDASVSLPAWVKFIDLSDTQYWDTWNDWVFETWSSFAEEWAKTIATAQSGNPDFRGVIYFQLPSWYALRESAKTPITYQYYNTTGVLVNVTETLANYSEYSRANPVTSGVDMERLMRCPYFAGMLHESTCSIPVGVPQPMNKDDGEIYIDTSDRFQHYFIAEGALAKKICRENGKLFGAFCRAQYFKDGSVLNDSKFNRMWQRTIDTLRPDIIATIGPWFFNYSTVPPKYMSIASPGWTGELNDVWQARLPEYLAQHRVDPGSGAGLAGEYFDNMDLSGSNFTRLDSNVNFDWGLGSPDPRIGVDTFSARWTGWVQPNSTGLYTFYVTADDGVRLWVNGAKIIDDWTDGPARERSGAAPLAAGAKYDIKLEYYENTGAASVKLMWSSDTGVYKQVISRFSMYPTAFAVVPEFQAPILAPLIAVSALFAAGCTSARRKRRI